MVPSTTTDEHFLHGVVDATAGLDPWLDFYVPGTLEYMAYYDGYIRRKYGLVDENGEEIFR